MTNPTPDRLQSELKQPSRKPHRALLSSFTVVLDACVLCNSTIRDFLLWAADLAMFRPAWTRDILQETFEALTGPLGLSVERADYVITQMKTAFPEAEIEGYEGLISAMTNDEGDRHVSAAAVRVSAELIVTRNVKHFPPDSLSPYGVETLHPDDFLRDLLDMDPERMIEVLTNISQRRKCPPKTVDELLEALHNNGCRGFAEDLRTALRRHYEDS